MLIGTDIRGSCCGRRPRYLLCRRAMDLRSRFHRTSPRVMCGLLTGFEQDNQRRSITVRNRTDAGVTASRRTGNKERLTESTQLRVLDCFPSGAYALHALLQQLEISESRTA